MAKIEVRKIVSVTVNHSRPFTNPKTACVAWAKEAARRIHRNSYNGVAERYQANLPGLGAPLLEHAAAMNAAVETYRRESAEVDKLVSATRRKAYRRAKPIFDKLFQN